MIQDIVRTVFLVRFERTPSTNFSRPTRSEKKSSLDFSLASLLPVLRSVQYSILLDMFALYGVDKTQSNGLTFETSLH